MYIVIKYCSLINSGQMSNFNTECLVVNFNCPFTSLCTYIIRLQLKSHHSTYFCSIELCSRSKRINFFTVDMNLYQKLVKTILIMHIMYIWKNDILVLNIKIAMNVF